MKDNDARRIVRLEEKQIERLNALREIAARRTGVPVSLAAMSRLIVEKGLEAVEAKYKRKG